MARKFGRAALATMGLAAASLALGHAPTASAAGYVVIWDSNSYVSAWGYAYKAKNCTGTRVRLGSGGASSGSAILSIKSPSYYTEFYNPSSGSTRAIAGNTCYNIPAGGA